MKEISLNIGMTTWKTILKKSKITTKNLSDTFPLSNSIRKIDKNDFRDRIGQRIRQEKIIAISSLNYEKMPDKPLDKYFMMT